jgi:hypothetical protein
LPASIVTTGLFEAGVGASAAVVQTTLKSSSQSDFALIAARSTPIHFFVVGI